MTEFRRFVHPRSGRLIHREQWGQPACGRKLKDPVIRIMDAEAYAYFTSYLGGYNHLNPCSECGVYVERGFYWSDET